ncbi:hypothetical protein B0H66DRAFT_610206 [Apodospora peruviana]|uniref:Uncharacterized protein n=1 Tax=Apodospora peruviana TaxID=516989 RepID=A0AAE0IQN5_9PEZI|nr:hypothetical protein B0H66DRAFT_610206 [Apodospora peruviana]
MCPFSVVFLCFSSCCKLLKSANEQSPGLAAAPPFRPVPAPPPPRPGSTLSSCTNALPGVDSQQVIMDANRNKPHSKPKHISRITKEMHEFRLKNNPFSSPPSSTGSHDTVSTTTEELTRNLSNFSFSPDGEGTRKFSEDFKNPPKRSAPRSGRFGGVPNTVVNTSAIAHAFPEWSNLVNNKNTATISESIDIAASFKPITTSTQGMENRRPTTDQTEEDTFEDALDAKRRRFRSEMQPRVEDESDCSTVLSKTPGRPALGARRPRFSNGSAASPEPPKRSLQEMVSKIRVEKQTMKNQASPHDTTPKQSPPNAAIHSGQFTFRSSLGPDGTGISPTGRSFFLPAFRHLPDWTSGTLKFSSMRNGVPVFVKAGKAGVQLGSSGEHGSVNAVGIPEEDEEIFVSMDKLQEEVRELHDHDAMLQREAEKLQRELNLLQSELKRLKSRKTSDSAIGSDSDGSFNRRNGEHNQELEDQVAHLQGRLDQASRQVGVNDIHSTALTAERDEALHQASIARERAKKLQAELETTQKELESALQDRHEKETMELENTSLVATNLTLKQQHDSAVQNHKKLAAQCDRLRQELATVRKELATTREELDSTRKQCESLKEENKLMAQDHTSMERSNETYFKENKKLQAQVAARDQHIADLKKGITTRDQMIDNIQGFTTDTAVIELNAELEAEIEQLRRQLQQQNSGLQEKDGSISAKEGRIRVLKERNLELTCENERLEEENRRLRAEYEEKEGQWISDRHKVIQLNQQLTKNNTEYLRTLNDNTEDCVRLEEDFRQKETTIRQRLGRREAAIRKVKQLTSKINEIAQQELIRTRTTKVTRIVEPGNDYTGKSDVYVDDDPTTEVHLTQGSDFASIMDDELARLKQTYRDLQAQQQEDTQAGPSGNTLQITEYDLPTLPAVSTIQPKQPTGILKKSSQFPVDDDTGRFSVKSALSIGIPHSDDETNHTATTNRSRRSVRSASNVSGKPPMRPELRLRRNSDTAARLRTEATTTVEQNMTSAFFVPDITLHSEKDATATGKRAVPSLSKDARRVLNSICKHKSDNCNVCVRIAAYGTSTTTVTTNKVVITADDARKGKKTVRVGKPVPVSDRMPEGETAGEADQTMRPSMSPGEALAMLIKETQDEIEHLQMDLEKLNEKYFGLDKSLGQRERKRIMGEIKRLQAEVEYKSGQLYRLHDVLEGQKEAGQMMAQSEVDVTILSELGLLPRMESVGGNVTATTNGTEGSWNGFD